MRAWIRNYFGFSQREANGTIVLFVILIFVIALPKIFSFFVQSEQMYYQDAHLDSLVAQIVVTKQEPAWKKYDKYDAGKEDKYAIKNSILFPFDPNKLSVDSLVLLGFNEKLSARIDNYRKKGGQFRKKEDLKKMYGLSEQLYEKVEDYIVLPEKVAYQKRNFRDTTSFRKKYERPVIVAFDANTADSTTFINLKGIGASTARRILKYRTKLGGFVSQEQFREVYGLDSLALDELFKYAKVTSEPTKIRINHADEQGLKHPYMPYKLPRLIVNYRNQHGNFNSVEELLRIKVLKSEELQKIKPYLTTD
jgi:competence protein ComEA